MMYNRTNKLIHTPALLLTAGSVTKAQWRRFDMKSITLSRGKVALVDDADYEYLSKYGWYFTGSYAARSVGTAGKNMHRIYMHRQIMSTPDGMDTDHINGDKLDNRRENLRVCTPRENKINTGLTAANTSGHRGVRWNKKLQKWEARICVNHKQIHLGLFMEIEEAARAYDDAAREYYGEFAYLNGV